MFLWGGREREIINLISVNIDCIKFTLTAHVQVGEIANIFGSYFIVVFRQKVLDLSSQTLLYFGLREKTELYFKLK